MRPILRSVRRVPRPAYSVGVGPTLCLDEAHHNYHTLDNRFWPFGELARRDGFRVSANRALFDSASLDRSRILVISNAQPNDSSWDDYPTPTPSAFRKAEIKAVATWVEKGGSLLLIADHMPLAGAAAQLAKAFGVSFTDGFAVEDFKGGEAERQARGRHSSHSQIVTDMMPDVMKGGGNDVDAFVTRVISRAIVQPEMTKHTGTVSFPFWEAKTGKTHCLQLVAVSHRGLYPTGGRPIPCRHSVIKQLLQFKDYKYFLRPQVWPPDFRFQHNIRSESGEVQSL